MCVFVGLCVFFFQLCWFFVCTLPFTADSAATDWNAVAVDYNHYPTTQYANSGPYGTSIGATYEYGGVNDHRPESPSDDKVSPISRSPRNSSVC